MQAYEVPQASAYALLGADYSGTLQASSTPLLVLPIPGDTTHPQPAAAAAAAPEPSYVFSSPSAAQSHNSPPSHELPSRQVSASQAGKRKHFGDPHWHDVAPQQVTDLPSAASVQTDQAGGERPLATRQRPAAARQHSRAGQGEERRIHCSLLVPCCEAVHGRFPLNGTYFQTNEVFLDAATLEHPVMASPQRPTTLQLSYESLSTGISCCAAALQKAGMTVHAAAFAIAMSQLRQMPQHFHQTEGVCLRRYQLQS